MATMATVQGPTPGSSPSAAERGGVVGAGSEVDRPVRERRRQPHHGGPPRRGHRQYRGVDAGDGRRSGEQPAQPALGIVDRLAGGVRQPGGQRPGGRHRDLLTEHDAQRHLGGVDRTRDPAPGRGGDVGRQRRVGGQRRVDAGGVGVEVEQAAAGGDGRRQVGVAGQVEPAGHVVGVRRERHDARARGQPQRPAQGAVAPLLDAGHGGGGQVAEQAVGPQRRAEVEADSLGTAPRSHGRGSLTCDLLVTYGRPVSDDDRVFKALADPTRRLLLDRLFVRDGRTLSELEADVDMTRFGVMKHLRVLEDAGLVVTRRSGREKLHFLNPVPIRLIHDRWIDKYTEHRVTALTDLKRQLEADA